MLCISLVFIQMGEDCKVGHVDTNLEMIKWRDYQVTFLVTTNEEYFFLFVYLDNFVLVGHLYALFWKMNYSIHY